MLLAAARTPSSLIKILFLPSGLVNREKCDKLLMGRAMHKVRDTLIHATRVLMSRVYASREKDLLEDDSAAPIVSQEFLEVPKNYCILLVSIERDRESA